MSQLKGLLRIEDDKIRLRELVNYARSLKINLQSIKNADGTYSENKLTVAVYQKEQSRKYQVSVNRILIILGVVMVFFIIMTVRMMLFTR